MRISKFKAGVWAGSILTVIFGPVILIVQMLIMSNESNGSVNMAGVVGALIGYGLCIFLAYYLRKTEKEKCGNNPEHMKEFTKIGFKYYILFVLFSFIIIFIWVIKFMSGSHKKISVPERIADKDGNYLTVTTDVNGNPHVCRPDGTTSPLREYNGTYIDYDGNEYDSGWSNM